VYTYADGAWSPLPAEDRLFVYQGWNLLMELDGLNDHAAVRKYTWGLDLSGTLTGAGGIGGLLGVFDSTVPEGGGAYIYFADANGNVGQVVQPFTGEVVARYEYDPYGNTLVAEGAYAASNPFRFSSKYWDNESGLGYWGYRYYTPRLGRWMSRDPKGEVGGLNLYAYVNNRATDSYDRLGLESPAASQPCNVCGPDVTDAVNELLDDIDFKFENLLDDQQKQDLCSGYLETDRAAASWDTDFYSKATSLKSANCPQGDSCGMDKRARGATGGASVTFMGRCYASYDVNYVLYGRLARNCKNELTAAFWLGVWKTLTGTSEREEHATRFFMWAAGYGPKNTDSPDNLKSCRPCKEEKWNTPLGWHAYGRNGVRIGRWN